MILTWGTWSNFQELLATLKSIADKYSTSSSHQNPTLTNVATRWVLDRPEVASIIVGTRLGISSNVQENLNVFKLQLDEDDRKRLDSIALGARTRKVWELVGDCGAEYSGNTKSKV
jgi:aryl-alcohol dehydrogenase-like predicted oxidoreductase